MKNSFYIWDRILKSSQNKINRKTLTFKIMKKILIALAVVLFTINVGAQDTKSTAKATSKKESCCKKAMTAEEITKCQEKCKAEGKECTAGEMTKCKTAEKSCCAKK